MGTFDVLSAPSFQQPPDTKKLEKIQQAVENFDLKAFNREILGKDSPGPLDYVFRTGKWTQAREMFNDLTGKYIQQTMQQNADQRNAPSMQEVAPNYGMNVPFGTTPSQQMPLGMTPELVGPLQPNVPRQQPIIPMPGELAALQRNEPAFARAGLTPLESPLIGDVSGRLVNPSAQVSPYQSGLLAQSEKGHIVLPGQSFDPTQVVSQQGKNATPQQIESALNVIGGGRAMVALPPTLASKSIEERMKVNSPVEPKNEADYLSMEMFNKPASKLTQDEYKKLNARLEEKQHPTGIHKNAIAKIYGANNYDDLARNNSLLTTEEIRKLQAYSKKTGVPVVAEPGLTRLEAADATIYQRGIAFAGAGAGARAMAELKVPAGQEAANYYSVADLQRGRLISAADKSPGITKLDLRESKDYKFINPNDQQELQALNNARNTLRELFARAEYILEPTDQLKASTIQPALIWGWAQGGPGSGDVVKDKQGNPVGTKGEIARSFLDQMKSFGGVVARGVLAERGVLTDADRNVAMQAGVNASDTIQTMKQKQQFFEKLMNFQFKAIARLSDNPTGSVADLVKEKESLMKEAQKFQQTQAMPIPQSGGLPSVSEIDAELARRQGKK